MATHKSLRHVRQSVRRAIWVAITGVATEPRFRPWDWTYMDGRVRGWCPKLAQAKKSRNASLRLYEPTYAELSPIPYVVRRYPEPTP